MRGDGVSVIVPLHNQERYVSEALQSALDQTHREFEILVVENGSTDGGPALAEAFARRHPDRVRMLWMDGPPGVSRARNLAIAEARYPWIAPLDPDDIWMPDKLERQLEFIRRTEADTGRRVVVAGSGGHHIGVTGRRVGVVKMTGLDSVAEYEQRRSNCDVLFIVNALMDREAVLAVGGYSPDYVGCQDVELYSRLADWDEDWLVLNQPELLFGYRVHDRSTSTNLFIRQQMDLHRVHENIRRRRRGEPPLSHEECVAALAERPWLERANRWRRLRSRRSYRLAGGALAAGQRARGIFHLARALTLSPRVVAARVGRQVLPRLRGCESSSSA